MNLKDINVKFIGLIISFSLIIPPNYGLDFLGINFEDIPVIFLFVVLFYRKLTNLTITRFDKTFISFLILFIFYSNIFTQNFQIFNQTNIRFYFYFLLAYLCVDLVKNSKYGIIGIFEPLSIVMVANFIVAIFQIQLPGTIDGWILNNTGSTNPFTSGRHDTFANSGDPYGDGTLEGATANAHVFADTQTGTYYWGNLSGKVLTSTNTAYTWTPSHDIESADVLMVAGGGGGGIHIAGGGGAGGLLHYTNQDFSGQKTIIVGNGGNGGALGPTRIAAGEGGNTTFTGFSDAIGGGAASEYNPDAPATVGGSGGGGGHGSSGAAGTSGQGYAGANSNDNNTSGGGGGAGGAGTSGGGGAGGVGLDKSSVFGTTYGESGWFAGGGGGGARPTGSDGPGGQGGGGDGTYVDGQNAEHGAKHTGGGGGGIGQGSGNFSGDGGSGIVLVKFDYYVGKIIPKLTSISSVTNIASKTINYTFNTQGTGIDKVTYKIGSGSEVTTSSGVYTLAYTPADYGTTTITHAYAVDSSGNQLGTKFGPYSVTT